MMNIKNIAYFLVSSIAIVVILTFGSSLLIPFVFALILWFIVMQMRKTMDRIAVIKRHIPRWAKTIVSLALIVLIISTISNIIASNVRNLVNSYEKSEANLDNIVNRVNDFLNINLFESMESFAEGLDIGSMLLSAVNFSTGMIGATFMVILYAIFLFLEEPSFQKKIKKLFPDDESFSKVQSAIIQIESSVSKYLGLKTLISIITGVLSFIALAIIGVDYPFFWAFIIFILNYIPNIGSLIGTIFPVIFSFLQFDSFLPGFLVLIFVGAIQIVVGSVIDPKLMGDSINLSPLVIIISLSFWGAVWGITGMLLSVPIMVIMVIIFSKFPKSRPIAILLSGNGEID